MHERNIFYSFRVQEELLNINNFLVWGKAHYSYKVVKNKEIALGVLFSTIGISQLPYIGVIPSSFIFLLGANLVFARLIMPRTMTL